MDIAFVRNRDGLLLTLDYRIAAPLGDGGGLQRPQ